MMIRTFLSRLLTTKVVRPAVGRVAGVCRDVPESHKAPQRCLYLTVEASGYPKGLLVPSCNGLEARSGASYPVANASRLRQGVNAPFLQPCRSTLEGSTRLFVVMSRPARRGNAPFLQRCRGALDG